MNKNRFKVFGVALLTIFIAITAYQIKIHLSHRGLVAVNILVLPQDSTVTLDGKKVKAGINYIKSGTHIITASKETFATDTQTIKVGNTKTDAYLLPIPSSPKALDWLKNHPDIQRKRESYGGTRQSLSAKTATQTYPFISQLPYIDRDFRIDYGDGQKTKDGVTPTAIYIRASSPYNRREALNWIRQRGYDPSDYEVIFSNVTNPLGGNQ